MASVAAAALLSATAHAEPARQLDIPAGTLDAALLSLAAQTRQQLLYTPDLVAGREVKAVHGRFTSEEALRQLLGPAGGIVVVRSAPDVLVLRAASAPNAPATAAPAREATAGRPFVGDPATSAPPSPATATADDVARQVPTTVEAIEVTGSHIRGGGTGASPLLVLQRRDLDRSGYATLAGALGAIPQNFSGQATEASVATRADALGTNSTYASSVNLRGLGADATLVLIDGRRLAGSGLRGDFADLSTLPTIAIQRVEVLLDGASALYGSDAVGGVVNVILRRDLEGGEVRAEAGVATAGGPQEEQVGAVLGHTWSTGGVMVAYETYRRTAMDASERSYTSSADLRPFGGTDHRSVFSFPGNILVKDPITGLATPTYGIPPGQSGVGLKPSDFTAGALNLQSPQLGSDILPDQRQQSVFLTARQSLTPDIEVTGDLRYGERKVRSAIAAQTSTVSVTRANPFFVSPIGATSEQIDYSFEGELGNPVSRALAQNLSSSLGASANVGGDWRVQGYLGFSQERDSNTNSGLLNSALLSEALGNVADRPTTVFSTAVDGFFNPFTGKPANRAAVLGAIGAGFSHVTTITQVSTADLQADGTLFRLPAGAVKLAVGGQFRRETFGIS
ncbi:MAG TPA: TonB-dependent receptor, partial [Phenylobacterium sp.]|nr:TonB-dependent receptor [Phenylobacterium sp.]